MIGSGIPLILEQFEIIGIKKKITNNEMFKDKGRVRSKYIVPFSRPHLWNYIEYVFVVTRLKSDILYFMI